MEACAQAVVKGAIASAEAKLAKEATETAAKQAPGEQNGDGHAAPEVVLPKEPDCGSKRTHDRRRQRRSKAAEALAERAQRQPVQLKPARMVEDFYESTTTRSTTTKRCGDWNTTCSTTTTETSWGPAWKKRRWW